jgi:hypothetical protein
MQDPCEEKAKQGRCCTGSRCSRAAQKFYTFRTPGEKIGGEAEEEQGPKTNVQLGVGTGNTAQHTNMHTQEGKHCGADRNIHQGAAAKLTTALSNLINQGGLKGATLEAGKADGGGKKQSVGRKRAKWQQKEESEQRLCGGCYPRKARSAGSSPSSAEGLETGPL